MRILVVEDERKVASFIRQGLEEEGYAVEVVGDGAAALERLIEGPSTDLVVLDIGLPELDGLGVLKAARHQKIQAPVLLLTARDRLSDKVAGLDLGADDYLTKPFAFDELLARGVTRARRRVTLTAREYALLEYLMRSSGRVLTRPMLAQHVWGLEFDPASNIVDVYVGYLRRKIDGEGGRPLLHTLRGRGYVLKEEP